MQSVWIGRLARSSTGIFRSCFYERKDGSLGRFPQGNCRCERRRSLTIYRAPNHTQSTLNIQPDWGELLREKWGVTGLSQACRIEVCPLSSTKRPTPGVGGAQSPEYAINQIDLVRSWDRLGRPWDRLGRPSETTLGQIGTRLGRIGTKGGRATPDGERQKPCRRR
jgi:hypothetical protein